MDRYKESDATISHDKLYQAAADQPAKSHVAEEQPKASINAYASPATFIAELDSTPIDSKKAPLPTPSEVPISDTTLTILGTGGGGSDKGNGALVEENPASAHLVQEAAKAKVAKMKDPAVLVNLPTSPSAQAYETAQQTKDPGNENYFDPVYVDSEDNPAAP